MKRAISLTFDLLPLDGGPVTEPQTQSQPIHAAPVANGDQDASGSEDENSDDEWEDDEGEDDEGEDEYADSDSDELPTWAGYDAWFIKTHIYH